MSNQNQYIKSWSDDMDQPGTIESYGAGIISSLVTMLLIWLFLVVFLWAAGVNDSKEITLATKVMLGENYGFFSFLSAMFSMIAANSIFLLVQKESYVNKANVLRLHIQNYLVGLASTALIIGYFGFDVLSVRDLKWVCFFIGATWIMTMLFSFIKEKKDKSFQRFVGCGSLVVMFCVFLLFRSKILST